MTDTTATIDPTATEPMPATVLHGPLVLKDFQQTVADGLLARLCNLQAQYAQLANAAPAQWQAVRRADAAVVLQAPTGAGKTAIACDVLQRFAEHEPVLWLWVAPFAGLVEQARQTLRRQAPALPLLDLDSDRRPDALERGGIFVTTWSAVAASNAAARKARTTSDAGLSLDAVLLLAREAGVRIGCVIDEAHHGFHKAAQAKRFFKEVLQPDYALMMTATPRDRDIAAFEQDTGYRVGDEADWASVSRFDGVREGLLKRGVRVVRFLARDGDTEQLVDFEHLALREAAATHRAIATQLREAGIGLTPLMLVQVPDGKDAQLKAQAYLKTLGFADEAVRVHTAEEPDPDLIALANDPTVEVLIFKMAVAMGFDAPRAFTLAALRGARDAAFGVQVVGRIVRVHAALQGRRDLPESLHYGYVFLANAQSQEGLLDAGEQINAMRTQAPEIGTSSVFTVSGATAAVQLVRSGEPMALVLDAADALPEAVPVDADGAAPGAIDDAAAPTLAPVMRQLFALGTGTHEAGADAGRADTALTRAVMQLAPARHRYPRRAGVPATLRTELLPPAPADYEMQLVDFVEFSAAVLNDRTRTRTRMRREAVDIFDGDRVAENDDDVFADLSAEAIGQRARQVVLKLQDVNEREIRLRLLERFGQAIERSGAPRPDEDELEDQLDLVLVRNPRLLSDAFRSLRHDQVLDQSVPLPEAVDSELPLPPAARNAYGVMPPDLNGDELRIAQLLDSHALVRWWHRNPPRTPASVGLYRWDEGAGYFPDFVVCLQGREQGDGIALLEVKGAHLVGNPHEVEKAGALHPDYGRVFMVGRARGETEFQFLRRLGNSPRLESEGAFEVERMRW